MLKKNYSKTGNICRVTFRLPAEVESEQAHLCGEFNDWEADQYLPNELGSEDSLVAV